MSDDEREPEPKRPKTKWDAREPEEHVRQQALAAQAPQPLPTIIPSTPNVSNPNDLPDWLKDTADMQLSVNTSQMPSMAPQGTELPSHPLAHDNGSFKVLEIPANLKSGIIGKGGHLINYIRSQCQSDIQVQNPAPGSNVATIMIRGNIEKSVKMIQEQIEGLQKQGECDEWGSDLVEVPQNLVALVVGPQGKKIHELMEKSGCLIRFEKKTEIWPDAIPGEQICRVKGPPGKRPYGCQLVREQTELARQYDEKKKRKGKGGGQADSMSGKGGPPGGMMAPPPPPSAPGYQQTQNQPPPPPPQQSNDWSLQGEQMMLMDQNGKGGPPMEQQFGKGGPSWDVGQQGNGQYYQQGNQW